MERALSASKVRKQMRDKHREKPKRVGIRTKRNVRNQSGLAWARRQEREKPMLVPKASWNEVLA